MTSVHCAPGTNGHQFGNVLITIDPVAGDCVFRTSVPFKSNKRVHLHIALRIRSETLEPSEWQIGRDMYGVLHEGVVLTRPVGLVGSLYPHGVTPKWICDQLQP